MSQHRRRWTQEEKSSLCYHWETGGDLKALARRFGRTPAGVYAMAKQLGCQAGAPQGYEYLNQAAQRTGYARSQLEVILQRMGVQPRRVLSLVAGRTYHRKYVDPHDVDQAIARWLRGEPLAIVARRLGFTPTTVRKWLRRTGGMPAPQPAHRIQTRVTEDQVRRVMDSRPRSKDGLRVAQPKPEWMKKRCSK
jgi:transposase-like protein